MKCSHAIALFDRYQNGTISPAEKKELKTHIDACPSCKKQLDTYCFFLRDADIGSDFTAPPQLNAKIRYAIHQTRDKKPTPFRLRTQVLAYIAACSFLVAAGIRSIFLFHPQENKITSPSHTAQIQTDIIESTVPIENDNTSPAVQNIVSAETAKTPAPVLAAEAIKPSAVSTPTSAPITTETPIRKTDEIDEAEEIPIYNLIADRTDTQENRSYKTAADSQPALQTRAAKENSPTFDVTIPLSYREQILNTHPYTALSDDRYRIAITKEELEQITNIVFPIEETIAELIVLFQ